MSTIVQRGEISGGESHPVASERVADPSQTLATRLGKVLGNVFGIVRKGTTLTWTKSVIIPPDKSAPEELHRNFELGKKILEHVQSVVLFSSNYPDRSWVIRVKYEDNPDSLQSPVLPIIKMVTEARKMIRREPNISQRECYKRLAEMAEKYNIGNCEEMAAVGLKFAIDPKNKIHQRVEIFFITGGDHAFLVIGREEGTDPSDYKHWGKGAVICDPWASDCYPASALEDNLKDYCGREILETGRCKTFVKPFNPFWQSLKSVADNR